MKKIFILLVIFVILSPHINHAQTFETSLGNGWFFQGITGVYNTIEVVRIYENTNSVTFHAGAPNYTIYDTYVDNNIDDGIFWDIDMGDFPPNTVIWVAYKDINDQLISYSPDDLILNILPAPHWIRDGGNVDNVVVNENNSTISFTGTYPIYKLPFDNKIITENVTGIKGKPLNIIGDFLFEATYNYKTRTSSVRSAKTALEINLLNAIPNYQNEVILNPANCSLDQNLSLSVLASKTISTNPIGLDLPKLQFFTGGITISLDAGFRLYATLRGQVVIGQANGQSGFISSNNNKSSLTAVLAGQGFVRGGVSVLGGVASANASLRAKARLGVQYELVTAPAVQINSKNGGDLRINGEISIKGLWGLVGKTIASNNLYYGKFGDTTIFNNPNFTASPNFNTQAYTYRDTGTLVLPKFSPQPRFKTNGDVLNAVWIEKENELSTKGYLLFARLNASGTSFENQIVIESNNKSISNPQIGILSSGSAVITWSQNKFDNTTEPLNSTTEELLKSQEVWVALYDLTTNRVIYKNKIADQNNFYEGEANISVNTSGEALITYIVKGYSNGSSNIWFVKLSQVNSTWTMSTPAPITNVNGNNSDVEVVYTFGSNALAIWKWDPDANDETWNTKIMYSKWNGNNWDISIPLFENNESNNRLKELSLASNKDYFALALTYNQDIGTDVINYIDMAVYNMNTGNWEQNKEYIYEDRVNEFKKPRVAISSSGYATVCYQSFNPYADTSNIDNGRLSMFVSNLNNFTLWNPVNNNTALFDPNTFIWELTTGFGATNKYYVMTQEYNDNGKVTTPYNGVLFGNPSLSMVLRGLQVNPNLTLTDISEPNSFPTGIARIPYLETFEHLGNYPNPFVQYTTIEFHLKKTANVTLDIVDQTGKVVAKLLNTKLTAGVYKTDFNSGTLAPGIYFSRLKVDNFILADKMIKIIN